MTMTNRLMLDLDESGRPAGRATPEAADPVSLAPEAPAAEPSRPEPAFPHSAGYDPAQAELWTVRGLSPASPVPLPPTPFWAGPRGNVTAMAVLLGATLALFWQFCSRSAAPYHPDLGGWFFSNTWTLGIILGLIGGVIMFRRAPSADERDPERALYLILSSVCLLFASVSTWNAKSDFATQAPALIAEQEARKAMAANAPADGKEPPVKGVDCSLLARAVVGSPAPDLDAMRRLYAAVRCPADTLTDLFVSRVQGTANQD